MKQSNYMFIGGCFYKLLKISFILECSSLSVIWHFVCMRALQPVSIYRSDLRPIVLNMGQRSIQGYISYLNKPFFNFWKVSVKNVILFLYAMSHVLWRKSSKMIIFHFFSRVDSNLNYNCLGSVTCKWEAVARTSLIV